MLATLVLTSALLAQAGPRTEPVRWEIDPNHSEISFRVRHFVSKVPGTFTQWNGTIVVDAMNARDATPKELGGLESTDAVALAFPGAKLVKTFNQLPAALLASNPSANGGRRVMFVSGNDEDANVTITELVKQLGFAPIVLGKIAEGGKLLRYRGPLVLQDLMKQNN